MERSLVQRSDHRAIYLFASIEKIPIPLQPLGCCHRPIRVREGEAVRIAIAKPVPTLWHEMRWVRLTAASCVQIS
jgi:hypothetical protein